MSLESFERTAESSGQAYSLAGTWGRAYAGGALSGPVSKSTCNQDRESSEPRRRGSSRRDPIPRISIQQPSPKLEVQRTDSPKHSLSLSDPGDHTYNFSDERLPVQTASPSLNSPAPIRMCHPRSHCVQRLIQVHGSLIHPYPFKRNLRIGCTPLAANWRYATLGANTTLHLLLHPHRTPSRQTISAILTLRILARAHLSHLLTATQHPYPLPLRLSSQE